MHTYTTLNKLCDLYQMQINNTEQRFKVSKAWAEDLQNNDYVNELARLEMEQTELLMRINELEAIVLNK